MYKVNEENVEILTRIKATAYSQLLGLSTTVLSLLFNGKTTTKLSTAKAIISVAYNISVTDGKMDELLEKHFEKIN